MSIKGAPSSQSWTRLTWDEKAVILTDAHSMNDIRVAYKFPKGSATAHFHGTWIVVKNELQYIKSIFHNYLIYWNRQ